MRTSMSLQQAADKFGVEQVYRVLDWIFIKNRAVPRGAALQWALDNKISNRNTKYMDAHIYRRTYWSHPITYQHFTANERKEGWQVQFLNGRNQTRLSIEFLDTELEEFMGAGRQAG